MKTSLSLLKHKRIGFKRPVAIVKIEETSDQETEDEKESTDIDSNSISSPEESQLLSPIINQTTNKEKRKSIHLDIPISIEKEKTIPEPPLDLFECSFNWITDSKSAYQQDSDCDDIYFTHIDFLI